MSKERINKKKDSSEKKSATGQQKTIQTKSFTPPDSGINFTVQKKENNTGLPDNLKSGIENMSGINMSDVKVHYNSSQPAQLNAHAYAQGNQIHIAPGQQKHLAHEAWHVVQQKQGRVKPTRQLKSAVAINDDAGLEKEADVMGAKALQIGNTSLVQKKERGAKGSVAQKKQAIIQLVAGDPPAKLKDLIDETAAYNVIIGNINAGRRALVADYADPNITTNFNTAIAAIPTLHQKWLAYKNSFTPQAPGGDNTLFPAQGSYNADYDMLQLHKTRVDTFRNFDVDATKLSWIIDNIALQNRWFGIGLTQNLILAQAAETKNAFKGRIKAWIIANYLTKQLPWFYQKLGFNAQVKSWGLGSGTHTTLYKLNNLNQSCRVDQDNVRNALVITMMGNGNFSLHVTRELNGQNNAGNPKIYRSGQTANCNGKPAAMLVAMRANLTARENAIRGVITAAANVIKARLLDNWENA